MTASLLQSMRLFASRLAPRILTQACRDPHSPCYGCFDRNWWHYKIRDFPSIILQQGGYAAFIAAEAKLLPREAHTIAAASCRFWNTRALRWGAFEEYYPWEQGYPPLAFSTLAVAKLIDAGCVPLADIRPGLAVAARQLATRFEDRAANQQVAGLAALATVAKIAPDLVNRQEYDSLRDRTLALATPEGWFVEYGGPDLGYLAVTLDCLWDLHDVTADPRYLAAATDALEFIARFAALPGRGAGMHNARNTDYLVPYGIARFIAADTPHSQLAAFVLHQTWGNLEQPTHFAHAIDDRYWSHYIGHSLFRTLTTLAATPLPDAPPANPMPPVSEPIHLHHAGHLLHVPTNPNAISLLISTHKGAIFTAWSGDASISDFGWNIAAGDDRYVTHWWADTWQSTISPGEITLTGKAVKHREVVASPLKHIALRIISLLAGRRIIAALKKRMIFKNAPDGPDFRRTIRFTADFIEVRDELTNLPPNAIVTRAPRSSVRHVASADSYHPEDLTLSAGFLRTEDVKRDGNAYTVLTRYTPPANGKQSS